VTKSAGSVFSYLPGTAASPTAYLLYSWNTNGSGPGTFYCYASAAGGSVATLTTGSPKTTYAAAC
jgi:hypothetical protein